MKYCSILALSLCWHLLGTAAAFGQSTSPSDLAVSRNKKFSAEITGRASNRPVISVLSQASGASSSVWSHRLVTTEDENDPNVSRFGYLGQFHLRVTDDGTTVVLRPFYPSADKPFIRVLTQGRVDKGFLASELAKTLGGRSDATDFLRRPTSVLELFLDSEEPPIHALWSSESKQWLTVDLARQALTLPDPSTSKRLDELGLAKARQIATQERPDALRDWLTPLKSKVAQLLPSSTPGAAGGDPDGYENFVSYRFLTAQRQPEDKAAIEALLRAPLSPVNASGPNGDEVMRLMSEKRELGDELLAIWDSKVRPQAGDDQGHSPRAGVGRKLHYFGSIAGTAHLPFGAPPNSGLLWLYLIPGTVPEDRWQNDSSVLKVCFNVDRGIPRSAGRAQPAPRDQVPFEFGPVTPGDYRIKAVWDRRAPFADQAAGRVAVAEPGDYESLETKPLRLSAGDQLHGIALQCTNTVGNAHEYYAADEAWKAAHPKVPQADNRSRRIED